jgi:hypothetical protein
MKQIRNLKLATIIAFLVIVIPGKIAFFNFIAIFLVLINFIVMIGVEQIKINTILPLFASFLVILSTIIFFKKNKYLLLLCIAIQYIYLFDIFRIKYIYKWYFSLPLSIYLILSFILIYLVIIKKIDIIE